MEENGSSTYYTDVDAEKYRMARPELSGQVSFVVNHSFVAFRTWWKILLEHHIFEGSGFVQNDNAAANERRRLLLRTTSQWISLLFTGLWVISLFGSLAFIRAGKFHRWAAIIPGPMIIASAPLVYWQGDRVIFVGIMLGLPFAGLAVSIQWDRYSAMFFGRGVSEKS